MIRRPQRLAVGVLLALAGLLAGPLAAAPAQLWVAPNGRDGNPGTRAAPFASIAMAQRRARELRRTHAASAAAGIEIVLRGGTYALTEPLWIRWEDSGTAASPTIFESAPGERATISGGVAIAGWTKAGDVPGLPAAARGRVWVAAAPRREGRPLLFRALWVDGRKAVRAQTPNSPAMSRLLAWDRKRQTATIPSAALDGVRRPDGVELFVEQQWEIAILRLRSITVSGDRARLAFQQPESQVEFEHPWPQPILPPKGGGAFRLVNAIQFLDTPGEWYEAPATGRIYYWPRPGENLARSRVIAPVLGQVLRIAGTLDRPVEHVEFRDLTFAHTAWNEPGRRGHVPLQAGMPLVEAYKISPPGTPDKRTLENQAWIERVPAGVTVAAANHIRFSRCRFEHTGASALDLGRGVQDSAVVGCVFRDVGVNGIQVGSFQEGGVETHVPYAPADDREVCARIRIADNLLRDTANADWGGVAIISGYARRVTIAHNDIADTSYTGISVGWGWTRTPNASRDNRVFANRIRHVATRVCDTAGIYTLSDQPGTVVSENVVADIVMSPYVDRPQHWFYLYSDEGSSHLTVRDNWCPAERFLRNANGPGDVWERNGPMVSPAIRDRAGLEPAYRSLESGDKSD